MINIRELFSSLPDFDIFGIQFCCAMSGTWESFGFYYSKECYHNGERFIPGTQITFFGMVLQISQKKNWNGNHSGYADLDELFDGVGLRSFNGRNMNSR